MPPQRPLSPAVAGQCAGPAHGATLSLRLTLGRWEGWEEQGGAGQDCKGGGGEAERPVGNLTVLAWCGAAAGRAWRADWGGAEPALGGWSREWGLEVPWEHGEGTGLYLASAGPGAMWGQPCCACQPGMARVSARPCAQADQETGPASGCYILLGCCCASLVPPQPLPSPRSRTPTLAAPQQHQGPELALAGTQAVGVGRAGQGWGHSEGHVLLRAQPSRCSHRCSGSWRRRGRRRTSRSATAGCTSACAGPRRSSLGSRPPSCWPWARALQGLCCSSPS